MKVIIKYLIIVTIVFAAVSCDEEKKPSYDQLINEHKKNHSFISAIYGILVLSTFVYIGYKLGTSKTTKEGTRKNKFDQMVGNGTFLSEKDDEDNFHPTV